MRKRTAALMNAVIQRLLSKTGLSLGTDDRLIHTLSDKNNCGTLQNQIKKHQKGYTVKALLTHL